MRRGRAYVEGEGIEKRVGVIEEWRFLQEHDKKEE